ncbi:hypothetical protein BDF19DRAFT_420159 [Syncephalis fuscata]|nr:hypothetical protein BDF19DRAFT_420159 [Syncephalis fuscata]
MSPSVDLVRSEQRPTLLPSPPVSFRAEPSENEISQLLATLLLQDGTSYQGYSFGAEGKSIAGELVFQTGMVGYPESLTDPSYRSQILILTFPLIGNYGVPSVEEMDELLNLPRHLESAGIHVAALVVGHYDDADKDTHFSHFLAQSSLGDWLKREGVPAIYGVDTRALTKKIREHGVMLGKLLFPNPDAASKAIDANWINNYLDIEWSDPNARNLVAEGNKETRLFKPSAEKAKRLNKNGRVPRILAVDVGMKYNQIRCFVERGVELKVVPWNYDFSADTDYDGLFISNGPGDPAIMALTISHIVAVMKQQRTPIFGICLGHQLLGTAAGATTRKMKYGNRGHNIPCTDMISGRCYITTQNHGYAIDASTLPTNYQELFVNANDGSNEGIYHADLPYFSVQFHPEAKAGPRDTEYLFDVFIQSVMDCAEAGQLVPVRAFQEAKLVREEQIAAGPERIHVRKVLVLGSGGLSIGQAGEFDYSGSQAIKALREEGIYTVLINPNIATIQTSTGLADKVYFLPVTPEFVRKVIHQEKPDGIYVTFGGQTALSVGIAMKDEFEELGVRVLGTKIETVITTEDRELFAQKMAEINAPCALSTAATNVDECIAASRTIGFPLIIRAAYALGGLGSGFASNEQELVELCQKAFAISPQVLVERSMKGWKEIEYEVVRDARGNCITVCNMENFDPLGIHTGDSIVVAPSQTLSDDDYQMLRTTAVRVINHLGIIGECNIQYALNPNSTEFCIIEVNARLSRSSALASKATGYPLAFVAAKLGLGIPLNEIRNSVTKVTTACFEPSLDYVVVKIPRWDLKKFSRVSKNLSSSMKSVGEVMAIGRTFEETIQKAIRAVDFGFTGFAQNDIVEGDEIDLELKNPSDQRLFAIANAFHRGDSVDRIWEMTRIDKWFLYKLQNIYRLEKRLSTFTTASLPCGLMRAAKQMGFSDRHIALCNATNEIAVRQARIEQGITPFVKQIDTVAAEFPAFTNYLYVTYNAVEHDVDFQDNGVMVLGSGVYRIGSSVEFDWCAVRAIRTLRENGHKTVMINYNPETVSTDYDEADRLYFENITLERVLDIYQVEQAAGVIGAMGGQTPNNIAMPLHRQKVKIFGTMPDMIDTAENRYKFSRMLDKIGVDQPQWRELTNFNEAEQFCNNVGYPVLVRPSYVLSGAAMNVVYSAADLANYLSQAAAVSREHPVVITKFIEEAKEIEMDAVAKDGKMVMHVISEHVENAGVHSGDATLILPPQDLDPETVRKIRLATEKIGNALNVTGPFNIQFMAKDNEIKVIECNVRASRSFPFVSKVLGVDLIEMATKAMLDIPFEAYPRVELPKHYVGIKVPQFSFGRLSGADPVLGVEMASTGEVASFGKTKYDAYLKALLSSGFTLPKRNILLSIGSYKEKVEMLPSVERLHQQGYQLFATAGTADFLEEHGVPVRTLEALDNSADTADQRQEYSLQQHLANNLIDLYINLPSKNRYRRPASYMSRGYRTRRMAVDFSVPLITNVKCAKLFVEALTRHVSLDITSVDYKSGHRTLTLPGLINIQAYVDQLANNTEPGTSIDQVTRASLAGGFTAVCAMPAPNGICDANSLNTAYDYWHENARCDYSLAVIAADREHIEAVSEVKGDAAALLLSFDTTLPAHITSLGQADSCLREWPSCGTMLLANLHGRPLHVTGVYRQEDIQMIALSKQRGMPITCDVNVYNLFFTAESLVSTTEPQHQHLGTASDVAALWKHLEVIDCFSVGHLPNDTAMNVDGVNDTITDDVPRTGSASAAIYTMPLLLTAVKDGRLTIEDIITRLHRNPKRIFGFPEQPDCFVELEVDRVGVPTTLGTHSLQGYVHRVVMHGRTVFLDGRYFIDGRHGKNITAKVRGNLHQSSIKTKEQTAITEIIPGDKETNRPHKLSVTIPAAVATAATAATLATTATATNVTSIGNTLTSATAPLASKTGQELVSHDELLSPRPDMPLNKLMAGLPTTITKAVSHSPFYRKHITSIKQFTREELHQLFGLAQEMGTLVEKGTPLDLLRGRVLCNLFYEPSTRTSCSFEAAMLRLGGTVTSVNATTSSVKKGETLPDTAFLDVYTIREELGTVNGLTITIVGDLKNGRTVHSLVRVLSMYHVKLNYVAPESLRMPREVWEDVRKSGIEQMEYTQLSEVIADTDVLYVTRVQQERFADEAEYERVKDAYRVDNALLNHAKSHMIVMHPLPRVSEIAPEVDFDQRAAYFRQMRYGLYVRMALLALVLGKSN